MTFTRRPRGAIVVNGDELPGWIRLETEANEFSAPDTFTALFSMSGLPGDRSAKFWASVPAAEVEIFAGLPTDPDSYTSGDLVSIFVGTADTVEFDWVSRTIRVEGRDLTSKMMTTKTSEKFVNLSVSDIAKKIAGKYGLEAKVSETQGKAGRFYEIDHVDVHDERTEWDLLTWLAQQQGFVTFVQGRTLYFGPRDADAEPGFIIRRTEARGDEPENSNYERLETSRALTVAGDLRVTVRSWNSREKKAFTKTAKRAGKGGGDPQSYTYTIPGLKPDEAQAKAEAILADLSKHALRLSYEGTAKTGLLMSDTILLEGTQTDFDGIYFPEQIVRTISKDDGFSWSIEAKNHPPENQGNADGQP